MNLDFFFNPKSVAVIGACSDKNKVGYALMTNLITGKKRDIFPVTLGEDEVLGIKTVKSILDISQQIDLAVIAIPAPAIPKILVECGQKKVPAVIVISAGFKEAGDEGKNLEIEMAKIAKEFGIALLGPNCLGTIDAQTDFNPSFIAQKPLPGNIALLSQSGALGTAMLDWAIKEGVGFSKFISLGNEASLSEIDFLEYLGNDGDTEAIMIYLEKVSDGPKFMSLASSISKHKPVVVLKAGQSPHGKTAIMSHTGSLAPENSVFSSACTQSGIITANSLREFFNLAKLFQLGITKPLSRLVILTNGGGPSVITADLIDLSVSLSLTELSQNTKDNLKKILPPMSATNNPIDIIGDALADRYKSALDILCGEKEIDAILLMLTPQMMTEIKKTAELAVSYHKQKPIIPIFIGGPTIAEGIELLKSEKMVNFNLSKDAIEALNDIALGKRKTPDGKNKTEQATADTQLAMMDFEKMTDLFSNYGINITGKFVKEISELENLLKNLGNGPFAMKAISGQIIHKTDFGAVKLNINNLEEAYSFWNETAGKLSSQNPNAKIDGFLVQPMYSGKEIIIGMKRDPIFGPTILFGLGGIFTETLKDTSLRIAPVTEKMAEEMIQEIKGIGLLSGLRGEKPVNFSALAKLIKNISDLAVKHPDVKEIDLNPVIATPENIFVVDARVMI